MWLGLFYVLRDGHTQKKPVLSYELFFKYGGEGDRLK